MDELITLRQAARRLACSVRTLWRRIAAGDLPRPFRIGRTRYWRKRTLRAWLKKKEAQDRGPSAEKKQAPFTAA